MAYNWHEKAEKDWDDRADFWHSNSKEMWETGSRKDIVPFFKEYVPLDGEIGDLGCGDGYGAFLLSKEGYRVTGMDISPRMVEMSNAYKSERLDFIVGDLNRIPFQENELSGVMAINSLEWTEDPFKVLKDIHQSVKKGGYALFGILGPTAQPRINSFARLTGQQVICNTMMPWEFEKLSELAGWGKIAERHVLKRGVDTKMADRLPSELKQALSFMTLFMLKA
ncbi:class I SAM-dependent methyltransferase [Falsibacillus pallidus]|uniref:class I SAM-dependent methyltransferase n=1 Tax=Falsibacillus pallidus TaxID=493781 RepID=UPI003D96D25B